MDKLYNNLYSNGLIIKGPYQNNFSNIIYILLIFIQNFESRYLVNQWRYRAKNLIFFFSEAKASE